VVSDVPVDDEALLVTPGISKSAGAQSFGGAHRGRVCVRVFIGVSVCACCERLCCTVSFSKKIGPHGQLDGAGAFHISESFFKGTFVAAQPNGLKNGSKFH
jgi:hypothetical protein